MKRLILTLCLILLLSAGCATTRLPGETLTLSLLQRDALNTIMMLDRAFFDDICHHRKVVNTEVIEPPKDVRVEGGRPLQGNWAERWTLDRCGTLVSYRIEFTFDGKGGTYFTTSLAE